MRSSSQFVGSCKCARLISSYPEKPQQKSRVSECFGLECAPHNWSEVFDHAVHFHLELAMPNNVWIEMTVPQGTGDRSYMKVSVRINEDGYVEAPTKLGLGYELNRDTVDKMTTRIDR